MYHMPIRPPAHSSQTFLDTGGILRYPNQHYIVSLVEMKTHIACILCIDSVAFLSQAMSSKRGNKRLRAAVQCAPAAPRRVTWHAVMLAVLQYCGQVTVNLRMMSQVTM